MTNEDHADELRAILTAARDNAPEGATGLDMLEAAYPSLMKVMMRARFDAARPKMHAWVDEVIDAMIEGRMPPEMPNL